MPQAEREAHAADVRALRDTVDSLSTGMQRRLGDVTDAMNHEKQARREAVTSLSTAVQASVRDMKTMVRIDRTSWCPCCDLMLCRCLVQSVAVMCDFSLAICCLHTYRICRTNL